MFCCKCGTKIKSGAKYCHLCGTKVEDVLSEDISLSQKENDMKEMNNLVEDYSSQIKNRIVELYLTGNEINPNIFYKKAKFYEMTVDDVDNVCIKQNKIINYINTYIEELFEGNCKFSLSEDQVNELIQYGNTLGIEKKICDRFLEKYCKENEMGIKQEFLEKTIIKYGETGKIMSVVPEKYKNIQSISPDTLLMDFTILIEKIEKDMDKEYEKNHTDFLTDAQKRHLKICIEEKGLSAEFFDDLVEGYEKKSGIDKKRRDEKERRVYTKVTKALCKKYTIFGQEVTFDTKFFLRKTIQSCLEDALIDLFDSYEKMDKSSDNVYFTLKKNFENFDNSFNKRLDVLENLFEIELSDSIKRQIEKAKKKVWDEIEALPVKFAEICSNKEKEKAQRKEIKEERGRWQGGGFGVGGAIKGAATAGAMNIATGAAYSAVGMVGNAVSSLKAGYNKSKEVKSIEFSFQVFWKIIDNITGYFESEILRNYPQLHFDLFAEDTTEEQDIRRKLHENNIDDKIEQSIRLLQINPASWRNGFWVMSEWGKDSQFWDEETEEAFSDLEKNFHWFKNFREEYEELLPKISDALKKEKLIDDKLYAKMREIYEYMVCFKNFSGETDSVVESLELMDRVFDKIDDLKTYYQILEQIIDMSQERILQIGNEYCQNNEWSKAKSLFVKILDNNNIYDELLTVFYDTKDSEKIRAIELLQQLVSDKESIEEEKYKKALYILGNLKNTDGKTMLVYVAKKHNEFLLQELIKNGADVNILYQLLDETYIDDASKAKKELNNDENHILCPLCGKKISKSAKFCNFCGGKVAF